MKLTEVIQPSAQAIFESLKEDTEHTFNDAELKAISESVANFEQTATPMTVDEFFNFLNNC
jgi:hypothetical protein